MQLKIDVLPAPFGPITAKISFEWTVKDTPSIAFTPANDRWMSSMSMIGAPGSPPPGRTS